MRLKKKPNAPIRKKIKKTKYFDEFANMHQVVGFLETLGIPLASVVLKPTWDDHAMEWEALESKESFNKRKAKYDEALRAYEAWYEEFEKEIEAERARRDAEVMRKAQARVQRLEAQLARHKAKLEKEKTKNELRTNI